MPARPAPLSLAFCLLPLLAPPVAAGGIVDAAQRVEAAIAAGDFAAWQKASAELETATWFSAGLHFGRLVLTTGPAAGYGNYEARADAVYRRGEPIHLYAEPKGYGYGDLGGGRTEIAFDIDLRILDPGGAELVSMPDFMAVAYQTSGTPREFLANMEVTLTDAPAGAYRLEFTFRDRHGGQKASFTSDVTLVD